MAELECGMVLLTHVVERVREEEIFLRERTPTEQKVLGALMYYAGMSYSGGAEILGYSHETLRQWYLAVARVFRPRRLARPVFAVDEMKVNIDGRDVYVWAAFEVRTFEIVHLDVSPGLSSLDALVFLRVVSLCL